MRIAVIAHSFYPIREPFAGGLEMITYQLVRDLMERGHEVDLYAHPHSCRTLPLRPLLTEREVMHQFHAEEIVYSGMTQGEFAQTLIYHEAMARIVEGKYDIVHNHSLHHVPILLGNLFGRRFITSLHTPPFIQLKLGFGALPTVRQTTTGVSNYQREAFRGVVDIDHTVYNGIDLNHWAADLAPPEPYFFWMGRMCAEKAPHHAIEACLQSGQRLLLAGPVSNEDYFDESVRPHLTHDNITYLGHLTHDELAPVLRRATAYLFTSTWEEPYGLTLAESLASGTPVVAYRVGAAPEIITPEVGILVDKGDIAGLVPAMHAVRKIDRRACRERAERFCSATVMVDHYLSLYHRVLTEDHLQPSSVSCLSSPTTPIPTEAATAGTPISSVL